MWGDGAGCGLRGGRGCWGAGVWVGMEVKAILDVYLGLNEVVALTC